MSVAESLEEEAVAAIRDGAGMDINNCGFWRLCRRCGRPLHGAVFRRRVPVAAGKTKPGLLEKWAEEQVT